MSRRSASAGALLALLLALAPFAFAQSSLATLTGTVSDSSGALIPSAKVHLVNTATGEALNATVNDSGIYVIPQIKPGSYILTAESQGFKQHHHAGLILESGARVRLDISLELGAVSESVEVTASVPLLQSESSAVGGVVDNRTIANMPLIDRRAAQLVKLSGFVSSGLPTGGSANNSAVSIAGGRADNNQWFVDGGIVQNSTVDTPGLFFDPPIESLQEFRVSVSNFAAELGRTGGGVIQMTTKSGTNALHGSAYEYLRNDALDARSFFAATKPALRYNLFGASISGPIVRDRTHFFFNYEGIRSKTETTRIANIPSRAEIGGDFSASSVTVRDPANGRAPFAGNIIPANRLDPVGAAIAALYPDPNVSGRPSGSSNYRANQLTDSPHNIYVGRVDHVFSDRDRVYGRFLGRTNPQVGGPIFPQAGIDSYNQIVKTTNYDVAGTWSHSFTPTWLNEARYAWNRRVANQWHGGLDQGLAAKLGITGTNAKYFPRVNITGLEAMGNANRQERRQDPVLSHYLVDTMTKISGKHTLKWGADYRYSSNVDYFYGTAGGAFSFTDTAAGSGLAALLLGWTTSASRQENLPIKSRADTLSAFFQDDWKVARNLTFNLGLRWDYDQPRRETLGNRQSSFDRYTLNPVSGTPGVITFSGRNGLGSYAHSKDLNNFGPRVGFAWQATPAWVVRGGAGILYLGQYTNNVTFDPSLGFSLQGSFVSPDSGLTPVFLLKNGMPALSFPTEADLRPGFGTLPLGQTPTTSVSFLEQDRRNGYLESFNLNIQRQFGANWLTEAGYIANLGHKLPGANAQSINQVPLNLMAAGSAQLRRPFPQFSDVTVLAPAIGNSNYHGLNLRLEKRYSAGLHFQANYTWSRFIDDISSRVELGGQSGTGFTNYYNRAGDRGLSGNNISHRFVLGSVYELPFGAKRAFQPRNSVLNSFVSGWSLGYIAELRSGAPMGVTEQTNRTNSFSQANRPNVVGDPSISGDRTRAQQIAQWFNTAAFAAPADYTFGNSGKTVGFGPGAVAMDLSVMRDFRIHEGHALAFRGEMLNFINKPNFANPNLARGNSAFGRITALAPGNESRIIQLGLRYSF
ncbi:TonB-dependent receptor [uncultured Paludibaculum sp.]|uniref:TonB-dependent receptor n=1 Tax=uncultured Paludibaculum sp. TaxID=1765020 RepID=UPI002AAB922B|nr:TonB-dependent receptor [uncultured Paludibaculum sp.]